MKSLFIVVPIAVALTACGRKAEEPKTAERVKVAVPLETLVAGEWAEMYRASGTVEAKTKAVLSSQIAGVIGQINAEPGDRVLAGQVLVTLNAAELGSAAAQLEASRVEAASAIPERDSAIESAQSQVNLAEITQRRMAELLAKRSATQQEMDEAEARLRQARAELAMAKSRRTQTDSRIASTEQALKSAQIVSGYRTIRAPFAGVVVEKKVEVGMLAAPGVALLVLERAGAYRVEAAVEESRAGQVKLGQALQVIWGEGVPQSEVRISEIVPALDAASRTVILKADLPARAGLRSGQFVRVEWPLAGEPGLTVPVNAVRSHGQLQMVFVVENGVAHTRMVSLGEMRNGRYRVNAGLKAGDVIVRAVKEAVQDGVAIEAGQ